jgi:glutaredoxin
LHKYFEQVKKQQQHALFVLSGHSVDLKVIDVSDPANEEEKKLMVDGSQPNAKGLILPPQIFKDDEYCGVTFPHLANRL